MTQELVEVKLNDNVIITQGALKGLKGTIVQFQNTDYVQLELESLNQTIKVKIQKHILKSVENII